MLKITSLNKTYPNGVKALNHVTLNIGKGIFGLLGPNGAGKSSLMRTIATLQEADSGSVNFNGIDVLKQKEQIRNILGYLPQEFGVYPRVSAEDLLNHLAILKGIVNRKKRNEIVSHLLEVANLSQHKKKHLGGFSGGMKQRFGIAQALIGNPKIIIVDEPTAGLDLGERDRFQNLLSEISENITVIFSTHIVSDVSELCNDMAIIHNGYVLAQMSPRKAIDKLRGKVWKILLPKAEIESYSTKFQVISSRLQHGKTLLKIYNETHVEGFESTEPNIEDVYFSFIKTYI